MFLRFSIVVNVLFQILFCGSTSAQNYTFTYLRYADTNFNRVSSDTDKIINIAQTLYRKNLIDSFVYRGFSDKKSLIIFQDALRSINKIVPDSDEWQDASLIRTGTRTRPGFLFNLKNDIVSFIRTDSSGFPAPITFDSCARIDNWMFIKTSTRKLVNNYALTKWVCERQSEDVAVEIWTSPEIPTAVRPAYFTKNINEGIYEVKFKKGINYVLQDFTIDNSINPSVIKVECEQQKRRGTYNFINAIIENEFLLRISQKLK